MTSTAAAGSASSIDSLEPHRRHVVALAIDLSGFSQFVESIEPEVVSEVIANYQAAVGRAATAAQGHVVNFVGDAAFVAFNDRVDIRDPELRAARAALALRDELADQARGWRKRGYRLGFRLGLDSGYATICRVGFPGHYEYGVLGRTVNNAFKLNREASDGQIIATRRFVSALDETVDASSLGPVNIPGLERPIDAYEIVGLRAR